MSDGRARDVAAGDRWREGRGRRRPPDARDVAAGAPPDARNVAAGAPPDARNVAAGAPPDASNVAAGAGAR
jgi:hypothetical protein